MDLGLQDKVALVTGSSRGLGLASAKALAAEGARVMLTARGAEQLARAADEVVALSSADAVRTTTADLATAAGVERAVAATVEAFGRLDILVNNVGLAPWRGTARHQRRRVGRGARSDAVSVDPREPARRPAHAEEGRRRHHLHHLDLGARVGRPHDVQRREGGRDEPGQVARPAARARQHPRRERRAGIDPLPRRVVAQAPAGRSELASTSSFAAICPSGASAAPRKSATSSRFSRRRAPAG